MSKVKLVVMAGLPGSGKSSISEGIAKELKFSIFSVDPIESSIVKAGVAKSSETGLAAYLVAQTLADEHLKLGNSVIIDAVNAAEEAKNIWRDLAKKHGLDLIIIECHLKDQTVHRERLETRVRNMHGIPEVTWDDALARKSEYTPWTEDVFSLDSSNSLNSNIRDAIKYIQSK